MFVGSDTEAPSHASWVPGKPNSDVDRTFVDDAKNDNNDPSNGWLKVSSRQGKRVRESHGAKSS